LPTIELGTFIAFLVVPGLTLLFMGKIKTWGLTGYILFIFMGALSFLSLAGLSLIMASGYSVVSTTVDSGTNSTNIVRASNGTIITNSTTTTDPGQKQVPVIDQFQEIWAMGFMGSVIVFGFIYFKVMLTGAP
jgi:hypothetical protein